MEVKNMTRRNLPDIKYRLSNGASAISFRTTDGRVLKRYLNNDVYKRILETHDYDFLQYLIELDKLESELLVDLDEVFIGEKHLVGGMTYEYQPGTTINALYPKTDLIKLRNALVDADNRLQELAMLRLRDIHARNIVYTGDIKIIDTDFCTFSDRDETVQNRSHINNSIIRGLFGFDYHDKLRVDRKLKGSFDAAINGEVGAHEFIDDYINLLQSDKGNVKYYKHLTKDYIGKKHGLFGRR